MCKDPAFYGVIGLAWVGTICGPSSWKGYKASINEKRESAVSTAEVIIFSDKLKKNSLQKYVCT